MSRITFILALALSMACGCSEKKQTENSRAEKPAAHAVPLAYSNEAVLDLEGHVVERLLAKSLIDDSRNYFLYKGNSAFDTIIMEVDSTALFALRRRVAQQQSQCGTSTPYMSGLKLHLGIHNQQMTVLFQPLLLCKNEQAAEPAPYEIYDVSFTDSLFAYDPSTSKFAATTSTTVLQKYLDSLKIRRKLNSTTFSNHNQINYNISGDVTSVIFTFQEMYQIMKDNPGSSHLRLYNAIKKHPNGTDTLVKNSLLLASNNVSEMISFYKKYGNLAHLCPPNCVSLRYKMQTD